MGKYTKNTLDIEAMVAWAAASAAQRVNGAYIKTVTDEEAAAGKRTNRTLMEAFIAAPESITDADREQAVAVRASFKGLTFKIMKGIKLNDFENTAMLIANRDTITSKFDVAVMASLPQTHVRAAKREDLANRIKFSTGAALGSIGTVVEVTGTIVRTVYSQQYNTNFVTIETDADQFAFFSFKHEHEVGQKATFRGEIKAIRDKQTQLRRVKRITILG